VALTLAELLAEQTADEIKTRLLSALNVVGFPITDWQSGGVARTLVEMEAAALRDFVGVLIPKVAGGGFLDHASGDWLTLLGYQKYGLDRGGSSYTIQRITLTDHGAGPHNVNPGDVIVQAVTGNRYVLAEAGVVPLSGSVELEFQAESPGSSYSDPAGSITELVTTLATVTVSNDATAYSAVQHSGGGSGTVTPSPLFGFPDSRSYVIKITASGDVAGATATFDYSIDGGLTYSSGGPVSGGTPIAIDTQVAFTDGGVSPNFIAGETYRFSSPGSPIVAQGRDQESDAALRTRARGRWPDLSLVPGEDKYATWARAANAQVSKVRVAPHPTIPGRVDVTIAGDVNPLGGTVVTEVQDYVNERAGITDLAVVAAATTLDIDPAGTVRVKASRAVAVKQAADAAWALHIASLNMGDYVYRAKLVEIVLEAGAINVDLSTITLNLVAGDLGLASTEVARVGDSLTAGLNWVLVP
jgi:hypothetical protein